MTRSQFQRFQRQVRRTLTDFDERLGALEEQVATLINQRAVSAALVISTGGQMPSGLNVDTTNATAMVEFKDDHGDVADAPDGVQVTFTSSDPAVATVANDTANPLQGNITPVAEGDFTLSVGIAGAAEPNGQPFTVPDTPLHVAPGPASEADLVLENA